MVLWVGLASFYHFSDHTVAIVGLVSIGLWSVTLASVTGPDGWWLTILASLLGSLEASIEPALRTLITSIPLSHNVGKILALLGLMESIWLIVDRSLYTYLYNYFVSSFPQVSVSLFSTLNKNINSLIELTDKFCRPECYDDHLYFCFCNIKEGLDEEKIAVK